MPYLAASSEMNSRNMAKIVEVVKDYIIEQILNIEWEMFKNVKTVVPAPCQQDENSLRNIRKSIFEKWTEELLRSYLSDLINMKKEGRNPFTEKYGRMDGILPPLKDNPLIDEIVKIEEAWQREIKEKYPALYNTVCRDVSESPDNRSFSHYLRCELETYGDKTLELYYKHVKDAFENKQNLAIKSLELLVKKNGFSGLTEAETYLKHINNP
jgi:hypothetical protein